MYSIVYLRANTVEYTVLGTCQQSVRLRHGQPYSTVSCPGIQYSTTTRYSTVSCPGIQYSTTTRYSTVLSQLERFHLRQSKHQHCTVASALFTVPHTVLYQPQRMDLINGISIAALIFAILACIVNFVLVLMRFLRRV